MTALRTRLVVSLLGLMVVGRDSRLLRRPGDLFQARRQLIDPILTLSPVMGVDILADAASCFTPDSWSNRKTRSRMDRAA